MPGAAAAGSWPGAAAPAAVVAQIVTVNAKSWRRLSNTIRVQKPLNRSSQNWSALDNDRLLLLVLIAAGLLWMFILVAVIFDYST